MSEKKRQIDVSSFTDFEVSVLVIERDTAQFRVERIDELLNKVGEAKGYVEAQKGTWDPKKVEWVETAGTKGLYDKASAQGTDDFKAMLIDLKKHDGKLSRDGFFYWVFSDEATVGRKKTKR